MKRTGIKRWYVVVGVGVVLVAAIPLAPVAVRYGHVILVHMRGKKTIDERVAQFGQAVRNRLQPRFERVGIEYPPARLVLVGVKRKRVLHLYARGEDGGSPKWIHTYPVQGASGSPGPKLREGDRQVPEGLYGIESLNPNSRFHLALRVDYPNAADRARAAADGRDNLGGDIMIHGGSASVGCLAMGDDVAEELFVLAAIVGIENVEVILTPVDFRTDLDTSILPVKPPWIADRYDTIRNRLNELPIPPQSGA